MNKTKARVYLLVVAELKGARHFDSPFEELIFSSSCIPQCLTLNRARNGALAALCMGVPEL